MSACWEHGRRAGGSMTCTTSGGSQERSPASSSVAHAGPGVENCTSALPPCSSREPESALRRSRLGRELPPNRSTADVWREGKAASAMPIVLAGLAVAPGDEPQASVGRRRRRDTSPGAPPRRVSKSLAGLPGGDAGVQTAETGARPVSGVVGSAAAPTAVPLVELQDAGRQRSARRLDARPLPDGESAVRLWPQGGVCRFAKVFGRPEPRRAGGRLSQPATWTGTSTEVLRAFAPTKRPPSGRRASTRM